MPAAYQWRIDRLDNYAKKLTITRRKATKRLMLFPHEKLVAEFDRIVDKQFWSCNEPGIRYEDRQKRFKKMHLPTNPIVKQLSLFDDVDKINDRLPTLNPDPNFRLSILMKQIRRSPKYIVRSNTIKTL
jgi:hypothetical protein